MSTQADPWQPVDGKCNIRKLGGDGLCRQPAGKNTDHLGYGACWRHGGSTPNGRKNGAKLRANGEFGRLMAEAGVEIAGRTTAEALDDARRRAGETAAALGQQVADLALRSTWHEETVKGPGGGTGYHVVVEGEGVYGPDHQGDMRLHVLLESYAHWLKLSVQIEKIAADLGLEERKVRVTEQLGQAIVDVFRGALADAGIAETPAVREAFARRLRLVSAA